MTVVFGGLPARLAARLFARRWAFAAVFLLTLVVSMVAVVGAGGGPAPYTPLLYGSLALALMTAQDVVAGPLRRGEMLLWLQKPVHPVVLLASWLLEVLILTVGLIVLLTLSVGGGNEVLDSIMLPGYAVRSTVSYLGVAAGAGVLAAVMTFACSSAVLRLDALLAAFLIAAGTVAAVIPSDGPAGQVLRALAFPWKDLMGVQDLILNGIREEFLGSLVPFLLHLLVWTGVGLALGSWRCRSPTLSSPGG